MTIINAFHPDYVKTYHPELLTSIKVEEQQKANGVKASKLAPTEFRVFSRAGTANVKPKGKKK